MDISSSRWWLQIPLHPRCLLPITWPLTYCDVQSPLATTAACNADVIRTTLVDGMGAKRRQIFFCSFLHLTNYHSMWLRSLFLSSASLSFFVVALSAQQTHTHAGCRDAWWMSKSKYSLSSHKQTAFPTSSSNCISREVIYPLRYLPLSLRRD